MTATLSFRSSAAETSPWSVRAETASDSAPSSAFADEWLPLTERITIRVGEQLASAAWLVEALRDLRHAADLGAGWNGRRERAVHPASAKRVVGILNALPASIPRPHIVPLPSGDLQMEWHGNGLSIEIEVPPEGPADGMAYPSDGDPSDEIEWTVAQGEPNDLRGITKLVQLLDRLTS